MARCRCGSTLCQHNNAIADYHMQIRYYESSLARGHYPNRGAYPFSERDRANIRQAIDSYKERIQTTYREVVKLERERKAKRFRDKLAASIVLEANPAERKKKERPARVGPLWENRTIR